MPSMGQFLNYWYVIRASEYLCRSYILLVSPCVFIHVLTYYDSLSQYPIIIIWSPWYIHFVVLVLSSIQNWFLSSFFIFMIVRDYTCWLYVPPVLFLIVGLYAVTSMILKLFFARIIIREHRPRFRNSWPITSSLHDTSFTAIMAVPSILNSPS